MQYSAVIPFKTEMAIELQEKGRVRFWAQVGKFTSNCQVEYVFNYNIISQGKVRDIKPLPHYYIIYDQNVKFFLINTFF